MVELLPSAQDSALSNPTCLSHRLAPGESPNTDPFGKGWSPSRELPPFLATEAFHMLDTFSVPKSTRPEHQTTSLGLLVSSPYPFLLPLLSTHGPPLMASPEPTDVRLHPSCSTGRASEAQSWGGIGPRSHQELGWRAQESQPWTLHLPAFQYPSPQPCVTGERGDGCPSQLASSLLHPSTFLHLPQLGE